MTITEDHFPPSCLMLAEPTAVARAVSVADEMTNPKPPDNEPSGQSAPRLGAITEPAEAKSDFDAELRTWAFHEDGHSTVAVGRVFGDRRNRWPDGYAIITSAITAGARTQGAVITTRNTRYLLSGPAGDSEALLKLARQQTANAERRASVAYDERLFDLLPAAWGMDDQTFEQIAGLPARWLWQWRNHYRASTDADLARVRRLARFHDAIRLVTYGEPDYPAWWHRRWNRNSFIGRRSPLEAVLANPEILEKLEEYLRAQM